MVKRFTWIWMTVVLSVFTVNLHAQDWKSIITGIASAVGDKVTGPQINIVMNLDFP